MLTWILLIPDHQTGSTRSWQFAACQLHIFAPYHYSEKNRVGFPCEAHFRLLKVPSGQQRGEDNHVDLTQQHSWKWEGKIIFYSPPQKKNSQTTPLLENKNERLGNGISSIFPSTTPPNNLFRSAGRSKLTCCFGEQNQQPGFPAASPPADSRFGQDATSAAASPPNPNHLTDAAAGNGNPKALSRFPGKSLTKLFGIQKPGKNGSNKLKF